MLTLEVPGADGLGKTYTREETELTVGICEDVLALVSAEDFADLAAEGAQERVTRSLIRAMGDAYPVMARIFPGLTREEYREARPGQVGAVLIGTVTYTITAMMGAGGGNGKNPQKRPTKPFYKPFSVLSWQYATASA